LLAIGRRHNGAACGARKLLIEDLSRWDSRTRSPKNTRLLPSFASQNGFFFDFSTISPTLRGFIA
jgi:hypothetical protein